MITYTVRVIIYCGMEFFARVGYFEIYNMKPSLVTSYKKMNLKKINTRITLSCDIPLKHFDCKS